jgi:hypothetical protein
VARTTINFKNYNEPTWEEYTGEDPRPNQWYTAQATRIKYDAEQDQIMVICEIIDGDYKGWGRGWYAPLDEESNLFWKTHEIIRALQGGKTTDVTVDFEKEASVAAFLKKAKPFRIRTEEYNDKISIRKVAPLLQAVPSNTAPEPVVDEDDNELEAGDEPYTAEELAEMSEADLLEVLTDEFEYTEDDMPAKGKGRGAAAKFKTELVEAILAEQDGGDEEGSEDDEDAEEDSEEDSEFEDGFDEDTEEEEEAEETPEPVKPARRARKAAPAKAAPAAPAARRRRG